ncbi:hypothetical protein SA96_20215 [Burkholderia mallei]|nr:hypothetical protein SA96_20215 [Burkholderia mallei]
MQREARDVARLRELGFQRRRQRIVRRQRERGAVLEHAARVAQPEPAEPQAVLVEIEQREAPAVIRRLTEPQRGLMREMPLELLEVLRLDQHAVAPRDRSYRQTTHCLLLLVP